MAERAQPGIATAQTPGKGEWVAQAPYLDWFWLGRRRLARRGANVNTAAGALRLFASRSTPEAAC